MVSTSPSPLNPHHFGISFKWRWFYAHETNASTKNRAKKWKMRKKKEFLAIDRINKHMFQPLIYWRHQKNAKDFQKMIKNLPISHYKTKIKKPSTNTKKKFLEWLIEIHFSCELKIKLNKERKKIQNRKWFSASRFRLLIDTRYDVKRERSHSFFYFFFSAFLLSTIFLRYLCRIRFTIFHYIA